MEKVKLHRHEHSAKKELIECIKKKNFHNATFSSFIHSKLDEREKSNWETLKFLRHKHSAKKVLSIYKKNSTLRNFFLYLPVQSWKKMKEREVKKIEIPRHEHKQTNKKSIEYIKQILHNATFSSFIRSKLEK